MCEQLDEGRAVAHDDVAPDDLLRGLEQELGLELIDEPKVQVAQ